MNCIRWFLVIVVCSPNRALAEEIVLHHPEGVGFDIHDHLFIADTGNHRILELDGKLQLVRQFGTGEPGSGPGQLDHPRDVAVPMHRAFIVVADTGNHRIALFRMDGQFLKSFGEHGKEPGQFDEPSNVTIADKGHIIVTDRGNNRLQLFEANGKFLSVLENRIGPRSEEEIDAVLSYHAALGHEMSRHELSGEWREVDPGQFREPGGVFYDKDLKRAFVCTGRTGRIEILDYDPETGTLSRRDPRVATVARGGGGTYGCVGTEDGGILVARGDRSLIHRYSDRAGLDCTARQVETLESDVYGGVKGLFDMALAPRSGRIAAVDTHASRVLLFNRDLAMPEAPRVKSITAHGATIIFKTESPAPSQVRFLQSAYPLEVSEKLEETRGATLQTVVLDEKERTDHEVTIGGLSAGTRYYYRASMPGLRAVPSDGWTREYALNTLGGSGQTAFIRLPVKILLVANLIDSNGTSGEGGESDASVPKPEPMSVDDVEGRYLEAFREAQLFYWINSRMRYWVDFDFLVDNTMYRSGKCEEGAPQWLRELPLLNVRKSWEKVVKESGCEDKLYYGEVVCKAERAWNARRGEWFYRGSGGGTFGLKHSEDEAHGSSHFLGGNDIAWLFTHEYKHQMESQYHLSGLVREDDRLWFCHFATKHDDPATAWVEWKWDTAADHGQHWDGIAWQLRHLTRDQYMRNYWGEVVTAEDADEDGIPDRAPALPLDEDRWGSSPDTTDSDGDGLSDLDELLVSTWVKAPLTSVWKRVLVPYLRPDPTNPDSDGDGIRDGEDPYPIYPYENTIPRGNVRVDGGLADWKRAQRIEFRHEKLGPAEIPVDLTVLSCYSPGWLYYAMETEKEHQGIDLLIDANADGAVRGNDNIHLRIRPDSTLNTVRVRLCANNRWPYWDDEVLTERDIQYSSKWVLDRQEIEIGIPRRSDIGLELVPGERIGLEVRINLPEGGQVSVFEPYVIFDSVLGED
jgi:hypothetical protein